MAKHIIGVYMIRNLVNGRRYFGSTKNWSKRYSEHLGKLRRGDHDVMAIRRDSQKYGVGAFEISLVREYEMELLAKRHENALIEQYNTTDSRFGYNQMLNGKWSAEARIRNTEKKYIQRGKYFLLPDVTIWDDMLHSFVAAAMKGASPGRA